MKRGKKFRRSRRPETLEGSTPRWILLVSPCQSEASLSVLDGRERDAAKGAKKILIFLKPSPLTSTTSSLESLAAHEMGKSTLKGAKKATKYRAREADKEKAFDPKQSRLKQRMETYEDTMGGDEDQCEYPSACPPRPHELQMADRELHSLQFI